MFPSKKLPAGMPMNLRIKFTLYISVLLVLTIGVVSYTIYNAQKEFLNQQFTDERERTFQTFVSICTEALAVRDDIQVFNAIHSLINVNRPAVVYAAYVSDATGIMFASRDGDRHLETAYVARFRRANFFNRTDYTSLSGERIAEFVVPVEIDGAQIGTIIVGFSRDHMYGMIADGVGIVARKILYVSVIAFIIAVALANFMAYRLSKPLRILSGAARKIAGGDFNVRVDIDSSDELGLLARSFNDMACRVREIDTLKDSFVSSVSHELRSPLAAIDGYCDLLIDGIDAGHSQEQQLKGLRIVKEASLRLTSFVNNILDLAKIKAGKYELKLGRINMDEVIKETVTLFESLALTQHKTLTYEVAGQLPPVYGDSEKNKQIITNLLSNALKFTQENDEIKVMARVSPATSYGSDYVEFSVSDTGVGIPKEDVDKVFEKFYQVQESEFKRPKGTGLGLSLVYEFVRLQNGRIWAESRDKGTTFKFVLPVFKN